MEIQQLLHLFPPPPPSLLPLTSRPLQFIFLEHGCSWRAPATGTRLAHGGTAELTFSATTFSPPLSSLTPPPPPSLPAFCVRSTRKSPFFPAQHTSSSLLLSNRAPLPNPWRHPFLLQLHAQQLPLQHFSLIWLPSSRNTSSKPTAHASFSTHQQSTSSSALGH